eukprot:GFKZ01009283.1.p3 GENE.GFKZ01009283.1~~GFKZ01009283.1.p3  ORF type:complete len:125 (+),score=10.50 GFKZ01009283.1:95-469(+)
MQGSSVPQPARITRRATKSPSPPSAMLLPATGKTADPTSLETWDCKAHQAAKRSAKVQTVATAAGQKKNNAGRKVQTAVWHGRVRGGGMSEQGVCVGGDAGRLGWMDRGVLLCGGGGECEIGSG